VWVKNLSKPYEWEPAEIEAVQDNEIHSGLQVRFGQEDSKRNIAFDEALPANGRAEEIEGVDNLEDLTNVHDAAIMNNCIVRFNQERFYTRAGPTLIAVNPCRKVTDAKGVSIYGKKYMRMCAEDDVKRIMLAKMPAARRKQYAQPSHLFSYVNEIHSQLRSEACPQSIVLLGDSGSGKSTSSKLILKYLTYLNTKGHHNQQTQHTLQTNEALLQIHQLLSVLGNARSPTNCNSSRHGQLLRIYYDRSLRMRNFRIESCISEASRVVRRRARGDLNFHIFYIMCGAGNTPRGRILDPTASETLKLQGWQTYKYLLDESLLNSSARTTQRRASFTASALASPEAPATTPVPLPPETFAQLCAADVFEGGGVGRGGNGLSLQDVKGWMATAGLQEPEVEEFLQVLAAIIHLGNVEMEGKDSAAIKSSTDGKPLECAAELLGLAPDALERALCTKQMTTASRSDLIRRKKDDSEAILQRLCRYLYTKSVAWLVQRVNEVQDSRQAAEVQRRSQANAARVAASGGGGSEDVGGGRTEEMGTEEMGTEEVRTRHRRGLSADWSDQVGDLDGEGQMAGLGHGQDGGQGGIDQNGRSMPPPPPPPPPPPLTPSLHNLKVPQFADASDSDGEGDWGEENTSEKRKAGAADKGMKDGKVVKGDGEGSSSDKPPSVGTLFKNKARLKLKGASIVVRESIAMARGGGATLGINRCISILDMPGFEEIGINSLEQLVANYADEMLRQLQNQVGTTCSVILHAVSVLHAAACTMCTTIRSRPTH
jgi:hypothetical protein